MRTYTYVHVRGRENVERGPYGKFYEFAQAMCFDARRKFNVYAPMNFQMSILAFRILRGRIKSREFLRQFDEIYTTRIV